MPDLVIVAARKSLDLVDQRVDFSSIVLNSSSALPLALALGNKISRPSDSVSRPPHRLHRVSASKVSNFDFARLTDVSRFECDSSASTVRPRESIEGCLRISGLPGRHW